ncbi:MAG: SDR family oxidoreductase [Bryobacteraceae bacterium]
MTVPMENQVVLVVGASSGIGREAAVRFARAGARVMASARREERLRELKDALAREGRHIETLAADAADAHQMEHLAQHTRERLGEVDVLVFATGTNVPDRSMKRLTLDIWNMMVSVNLNAAYYITRALLPAMRDRGVGHLIYISSVSGLFADESGAAYQASKRGLLGLAHSIRAEEKQNGIRTCVVCPGLVDTEILDRRPVKPSAEILAKALRPEDVAETVFAIAGMPPRVCIPEIQVVPTCL